MPLCVGGIDESNLVARAQAGEQAAFAALVAEYSRKIYRVAKNNQVTKRTQAVRC